VRTSRKDIELGPRPGPKIRSGVAPKLTTPSDNEDLELHGDSEDEMPDKVAKSRVVEEKMIDLDDF
jgi:hypothetical protein